MSELVIKEMVAHALQIDIDTIDISLGVPNKIFIKEGCVKPGYFLEQLQASGDDIYPYLVRRGFFVEPKVLTASQQEDIKTFKSSKLLWWVNRSLHLFGWTLYVVMDDSQTEVLSFYPERIKGRGFSRAREEEGFIGLTEYLVTETDRLKQDLKDS